MMNNKLLLVAFVVLAITVLILLTKRREHLDEVTCAKRVANVSQQLHDVEQKVQDGKDQINKSQGALAMAS